MSQVIKKNPFENSTPDGISPEDVIDLFVPVFKEYYSVPAIGHTFINGSRGSGKSMIFRFMSPDCQMLSTGKGINELDYLAVHIPIKRGSIDKTELTLLKNKHGDAILNEHLMTVTFSLKVFQCFKNLPHAKTAENLHGFKSFYKKFLDTLENSGWSTAESKIEHHSIDEVFESIISILEKVDKKFLNDYIRKLIGTLDPIPYSGPICTFWEFLYPLLIEFRKLVNNRPIYLLLDDADNLSLIQVKILNTWVSYRTTNDVSFKISTQLKYPTYRTVNDSRIDTPHDYAEINISEIYTSNRGLFKSRVKEVVEKRLNKYGFEGITAEEFFPPDEDQENAIRTLYEKYSKEHDKDYAYRYSRPDFMKSLKGNLHTYSYSGFNQLVNISSGVMRNFIDFSHKMCSAEFTKAGTNDIRFIRSGIQDDEIKKYSRWFFDENFDHYARDQDNTREDNSKFSKLRNLIKAFGESFHVILFSEHSERRVFSFALQNEPDLETAEILDLGVQLGYFHKSAIGNKLGTGRSKLYILNRLLAPYFKLDPSSFAGYKFVTTTTVNQAMKNPDWLIGKVARADDADAVLNNPQQSLFSQETEQQ